MKTRLIDRTALGDALKALKLRGMLEAYQRQLNNPDYQNLSFDERFEEIVLNERDTRITRRQIRLLKESRMNMAGATFENYEYDPKCGVQKGVLDEIRRCDWIRADAHPWLLITGATGSGKTFLAQAIGHEACNQGISTIYYRMPELIESMADASRKLVPERFRSAINKKSLLIIDDFGLGRFDQDSSSSLLSLLIGRERLSTTIIVSQIPVCDWIKYLGSPWEAEAIVDRLVGASYLVGLKGESRRMRSRPTLNQ